MTSARNLFHPCSTVVVPKFPNIPSKVVPVRAALCKCLPLRPLPFCPVRSSAKIFIISRRRIKMHNSFISRTQPSIWRQTCGAFRKCRSKRFPSDRSKEQKVTRGQIFAFYQVKGSRLGEDNALRPSKPEKWNFILGRLVRPAFCETRNALCSYFQMPWQLCDWFEPFS